MNQKKAKAIRGSVKALIVASKEQDENFYLTEKPDYVKDHNGTIRLSDQCERHYYQKIKKEFKRSQ